MKHLSSRLTRAPHDDEKVILKYDEGQDILDIYFGKNQPATGVELTDHLLLRLDRKSKHAVSLTIHHFSILAQQTEFGPRSFPLNRLEELSGDLRDTVIHIMTTEPVNRFLRLAYHQASPSLQVPITYLEPKCVESCS